ncbi:hypothetical protein OUZ56_004923 [Daphnia magna]|uniref:Uncharacterized protein n=1 Tax=Daphnia magna TaxID=35525 RepID=A0ABQ9YR95_9CRUS|nr:hypothetical protein OUZ56_004923 [Daphnia magna]
MGQDDLKRQELATSRACRILQREKGRSHCHCDDVPMWKTIRGEGEGDGRPLGPDRRERGRKASESEPFPQSLIFFIQPIFHWPVQLASHLNSRYFYLARKGKEKDG